MDHVFKADNKGQAIIESLMALIISIPLIFFITRSLNQQINIILIDEIIEERIICELTLSQNCEQIISRNLGLIKPKIKNYKTIVDRNDIQITVTLNSGLEKTRSLNLKEFRSEF